jgi:Holliday junction resolvase RusA-like endonuclease
MTKSATDNCKTNGLSTAYGNPPWIAPELDSPAQRAKWDRMAAKPNVIHLRFLGEPAPQGSKQITRWGGLREVSSKIHPWRASVQYASAEQYKGNPIEGPVELNVSFVLPRSKSHYGTGRNATKLKDSAPRHHIKTPDLDKLLRGLLDPLTVKCGGNVLIDDSQIVELKAVKRYADHGEATGAMVSISIVR